MSFSDDWDFFINPDGSPSDERFSSGGSISSDLYARTISEWGRVGVKTVEDCVGLLTHLIMVKKVPLNPLNGLFHPHTRVFETTGDEVTHLIPIGALLQQIGPDDFVALTKLWSDVVKVFDKNELYIEQFIMVIGARCYAMQSVIDEGLRGFADDQEGIVTKITAQQKKKDNPPVAELAREWAVQEAMGTIAFFCDAHVPGFETDPRGFAVVNSDKISERHEGLLVFIDDQHKEMSGTRIEIPRGEMHRQDEILEEAIGKAMDDDFGHSDYEDDPDSPDNDDSGGI